MNKLIIISMIMLTACSTTGEKCGSVGIDTDHPDFSKSYPMADLDRYYNCRIDEANARPVGTAFALTDDMLSLATLSYPYKDTNFDAQDIEYQLGLWRKIDAREMTPLMAQQAWIEWSSQQELKRKQEDDTNEHIKSIRPPAVKLNKDSLGL